MKVWDLELEEVGFIGRVLDNVEEGETLDIRIIAIFVIFAASVIGAAPPLYLPFFKDPTNPWACMLRSAGAGIVLCLAVVHVAPYAYEQFGELSDVAELDPEYSFAGVTIVFGFLLMMIIEASAHGMGSHTGAHCSHGHGAGAHGNNPHGHPGGAHIASAELEAGVVHVAKVLHDDETPVKPAVMDDKAALLKRQVAAHLFELGCAVHSVIIGIALGVNTDNRPVARNYFIALVFHQLIEAIALGAYIAIARLGMLKSWIFIIVYSLTVSVGIAIGIGIGDSFNESSIAALAAQGTLNGVAVGILLYMATVQMVAEDFSAQTLGSIKQMRYRWGCFISFFIFSAIMSFIAIWA
ncbi:zinc-nutrition responsive transporter [Dunaliella salina]|uniref:Zinc-nutrition responsive transporter n=1 Tax=Dunaliella salina TaxID=3046 RepID=A0ABQ7H5W6_DUNSA|nr:zinc-nutrition responsive transporter [Dunaliella salina]|eukprot:KAF5842242.1 zinc-nutrition responsive transporter [Dunaliella salina]